MRPQTGLWYLKLQAPREEPSVGWWNPILSDIAGCSSHGMNTSASMEKQVADSSDGPGAVLGWIVSTLADLLSVGVEGEAQAPTHQFHSSRPGRRHTEYCGRVWPHLWRDLIQFILGILNNFMQCLNLRGQWLPSQHCCGGDRPTLVPDGWVQAREEC